MKYGTLTNPSEDVISEIKRIKKFGFDYVEIGIEGPEGTPEILHKQRKEIVALLKEYQMEAIGHTSYWIDLGSDHEAIRKAWVIEAKKCIDIAHELGIKLLNFHGTAYGLYMSKEDSRKMILDNYVSSFKELIRYAKKKDVTLMLENNPKRSSIRKPRDMKYIIDRVPGLLLHLDMGHAFIAGGIECVKEFSVSFKNKIGHVHIHDNDGENDIHLPLGEGKVDCKGIVRILKQIGYNKTISIEVYTSEEDQKQSLNYLWRLWDATN